MATLQSVNYIVPPSPHVISIDKIKFQEIKYILLRKLVLMGRFLSLCRQTVHLSCGDVILCPHFSLGVGFSPLPSPTSAAAVTTTVAPPTTGQSVDILSRSPAKVRVFNS